MIVDVAFVSLEEVRVMRSSLDTLFVSILDRSEVARHKRPRLAHWRSVLCLEFEDTCEETKWQEPGSWPDEPTEADHARYCQGSGERLPSLSDAQRLIEFVMGHHATDECLHLVVHCFAGISRSGAVAKWVSETLRVPRINEDEVSTAYANKRVLRLMDKAYGMYLRELAAGIQAPDPGAQQAPSPPRP